MKARWFRFCFVRTWITVQSELVSFFPCFCSDLRPVLTSWEVMLLIDKARGEHNYQRYIQDRTHYLILQKKKKRQHLQYACSPKLIAIYIHVSSCCLFKVVLKNSPLSHNNICKHSSLSRFQAFFPEK